MQIRSCPVFLKKVLTEPTLYPCKRLIYLVVLLILITGCSQSPFTAQQLPSLLPNLSTEANLQLQVTPSGRAGAYTLTGNTNLPEGSRLTVAAVRYLRPDKQPSQSQSPNQSFSILDYRDVKVNRGKWQTTLNLWKVAPSGQFQEAWQLEQSKLGITFAPQTEVTFLATVAPTNSLSELESLLQKQGIKIATRLVRNTADGEQHIQASQILSIALPNGQTRPPQQLPEEINGGWGPRFLLIPEPPNTNNFEKPNQRRTNAPLSPAEFLQ